VTAPAAAATDLYREADIGKAYDARLMRRLWLYIRPHRGIFWTAMLCLPATSACSLAQPYLLKLAIDQSIAQADRAGLLRIGALYGLAMLAEFGFLYLQYYLMMLVAQRSLAALRVDLVTHLQALPTTFFDRNPVGRLVTRLTTDVDVINEMFAAGALTILMDVATLLGIVAIMMMIEWHLALVTLAVAPVVVIAINYFRIKARQNYRNIRDRLARLNAYLQEALAGMTVIQLFARETASQRRFDRLNEEFRDANHAANIYEAALFSIIEAISSIAIAVILWYGGAGIVAGTFASAPWSRSSSTCSGFSSRFATFPPSTPSCSRRCPRPSASSSSSTSRCRSPARRRRGCRRRYAAASNSTTYGSPTSARTGCCATSRSRSRRARPSPWWARPGRARPPSSSCSTAAMTSRAAGCWWTASTCAIGTWRRSAVTSASCCRTCFSSAARWRAI
jgi:hypothetical protein